MIAHLEALMAVLDVKIPFQSICSEYYCYQVKLQLCEFHEIKNIFIFVKEDSNNLTRYLFEHIG